MPVTKCRILVVNQGRTEHHDVDLLLEDGKPPFAVLEWLDYPDGTSIPGVAVQLEAELLFELPGWGDVTHGYSNQIESPIPLPRDK